jgi:hypothetical protein
MATKDTLCMAGLPAPVATIIGEFIDAQQADDTELADLAANLTATAAELNTLTGVGSQVTWAVTAGAANVCILTGTVKNAAGTAVSAVHILDVYLSTAADGSVISATSYSTGASITTGAAIVTQTANKAWRVATNSSGVFAISITATGKPATEYAVAVIPRSSRASVSAASAALWG